MFAKDHIMAQVFSRLPLTTEARIRSPVGLCGICGGRSVIGTGFTQTSWVFPVNVIPPWLSVLIYVTLWPQFKNIVSLHCHEQQHCLQKKSLAYPFVSTLVVSCVWSA
jgi:hypothetical protein